MKKGLVAALLGLIVLSIAGFALARGQSSLADLRNATAPYHDIDVAKAAGYTVELPQTAEYGGGTCIANGDAGAMGIHMLNPGLVDGTLDPTKPEALLYEKRNNDTFKLTGVEYIVGQGGDQPSLYGRDFSDTNLRRYGSPTVNVWTLHAWVWKPNPAGILSPWNPRVSC